MISAIFTEIITKLKQMTSIFENQNKIDPLSRVPDESDTEYEETIAKIGKMTVEEIWGPAEEPEKKPEPDMLSMLLTAFPGSKVISSEPISETPLSGLLDVQSVPEQPEEPKNAPTMIESAKNDMLEAALRFVRDGKSVIPVGVNKRPLLAWQEYQKRLPTEDEVTVWFTQWPKAQIALVTGQISDICVVDVEKEFGDYRILNLPETTTSRTGSGGWHLFYKYVPGVRNRAKLGGKDVDIRGEGGYVLVPPSSNEYGKYEWLTVKDALPPFPIDKFGADAVTRPKEFSKDGHEFVDLNYKGSSEGGRNDEMTRYIGAILTQIHPLSWEQIAWPMAQVANENNEPPLDDAELRRTFDSVCRLERETEQKRWWEYEQEKKELLQQKELQAVLETGEDKVLHISAVAEERRTISGGKRYSTGFATFDASMKNGFKDGDLVILTGISGQGKTSFGQTLTYNLCAVGAPCCWFSWETTVDVLDEKFVNMGIKNTDFYNVYVPRKNTTGDVAWLRTKIEEAVGGFGVKAFFIDMIDYVVPNGVKKSDNETTILKRATNELKALAVELRVIIFTMAHVRKLPKNQEEPDLQDIAHSSGIFQFADHVFAVSRISEFEREGFSNKKERVWTNKAIIRMLKNRETGELPKVTCVHQNDMFFPAAPTPKGIDQLRPNPYGN